MLSLYSFHSEAAMAPSTAGANALLEMNRRVHALLDRLGIT